MMIEDFAPLMRLSSADDWKRASNTLSDCALRLEAASATEVEPLVVAKMLAKIAEEEALGLVILGKQAIDNNSN